MNATHRTGISALLLAGGLLVVVGCEDSGVTAPADGTLTVTANPSSVVINPVTETEKSSQLEAELFDADGRPLQGIEIKFSTSGGVLASNGVGVKTDAQGAAKDTLTLTTSDPDSTVGQVEVTARASSLSAKVTVKRSFERPVVNQPPTAGIVDVPQDEQAKGKPVIFDGTTSIDPDGDLITMYKWTVTSSVTEPGRPNPEIVEDPAASGLERIYTIAPQTLAVVLQVTDDPDAVAKAASGTLQYSPNAARLDYHIVAVTCGENQAPTAVITGTTIQRFGGPGQLVDVPLDGTLSSDPETAIDVYTWNCGNGSNPTLIPPGSRATCFYTVQSVPVTYTATLVVKDKGTGTIDPGSGTYPCAKLSAEDSVQVVISPLQ